MEKLLQAMEMNGLKRARVKPKKIKNVVETTTESHTGFPCYEIYAVQEPPSAVKKDEIMHDDEDDVGMLASGTSDTKIQQMLAKYMAEEEDEGILAALRGEVGNSSSGGRGRTAEEDERLAPEDHALLTFTDRIKRAPRQIARYAVGGIPLWSVPLPQATKVAKQGGCPATNYDYDPLPVPPCPCGANRVFECQLVPSLLHVLEVDKFAPTSNGKSNSAAAGLDFDSGGQNWGSLAVYSCPQSCESSREEFVVVQDSVDGKPEKILTLGDAPMAVEVQMGDTDEDVDEDEFEYDEELDDLIED
jgi:hypothetical protein